MKELELSIQDIRDLMDAFHRNGLGSLIIQQGEFSIKMESPRAEQVMMAPAAPVHPVPIPVGTAPGIPPAEVVQAVPGHEVTSPIVGTFYAAPSPDQAPFVRIGSKVTKGDVLFIIESMKLMNEVISERDGTITHIWVENGQGVEYGQPILQIE